MVEKDENGKYHIKLEGMAVYIIFLFMFGIGFYAGYHFN